MEDNAYAPPQAELIDQSNAAETEYYVLPLVKYWVFSIVSLGIFTLPWSYLHWRRIKHSQGSDIWPVPRAIFSILFVHSLFRLFEEARARKHIQHRWSPAANATLFVIFSVIANLLDRAYALLSIEVGVDYWLILLVALIVPLWTAANAQRVANIAAGDLKGISNSRWTLANFLWLAVCPLVLALTSLGIIYPFF